MLGRALALSLVAACLVPAVAGAAFESSVRPVPKSVQTLLKKGGFWERGCPVGFRGLRLLTVTHRDFKQRTVTGQLIVNRSAARPLVRVFRQLYRLHFPIRHMQLRDVYGPRRDWPKDGDVSGSFECRSAVPSPCSGGDTSRNWSNHAYGLAIDLNPVENPYVGCGMSRDPKAQSYRDRSRHRPGMVTRRVIKAFASIGWEWGGAWAGNTKDYMHFSHTGR